MTARMHGHNSSGSWPEMSDSVAPRAITPRDPTLATDGPFVAATAETMGTPLFGWQQTAADVALERLPDGRYHYSIVVVTVPRQSGKTTLLHAVALTKMMRSPRCEVYYTAQTGKDARERWMSLVERIEADTIAASKFKIYRGAGSPRIVHRATGSRYSPFPPTPESLHGYTPHDVHLDEAFAHDEVTGDGLLGGIIPAQSTILDSQLWIVSTMGTDQSVFFHKWVEAARAGQSGVCLIDYGAADGIDVFDPAEWPRFHPAIGHATSSDKIKDAANSLTRSEFTRAYGNRPTRADTSIIDPDYWQSLADHDMPLPDVGNWVLTFDVAHDRTAASIMATYYRANGRIGSMMLERRPGVEWLPDAIAYWRERGRPYATAADDGGPTREALLHIPADHVTRVRPREWVAASGNYLSTIKSGSLEHDGTSAYAAAISALATKQAGDRIAISRKHSSGDVSPAVAAAIGVWLLQSRRRDTAPPIIATRAD